MFITGQVSTFRMRGDTGVRQIGFQETPIVDVAKSITKYAYTIKHPSEIKYQIQKALHIARSGRPGPVLIDIPDDLQRVNIESSLLKNFQPDIEQEKGNLTDTILNIMSMIKKSKRPVIIAGWGIHLSLSLIHI